MHIQANQGIRRISVVGLKRGPHPKQKNRVRCCGNDGSIVLNITNAHLADLAVYFDSFLIIAIDEVVCVGIKAPHNAEPLS